VKGIVRRLRVAGDRRMGHEFSSNRPIAPLVGEQYVVE
jgi:hypothetical protein